MSRWKRIPTFLLTVTCLLAIMGCEDVEKQKAIKEAEQAGAELAELKVTLKKAQSERDAFKASVSELSKSLQETKAELTKVTQTRGDQQGQIDEITVSRDELQKQVVELTKSCNNLQQQIEELARSRDELQQKVDTLTDERDELQERIRKLTELLEVTPADAGEAQASIQQLTAQLRSYVTDISGLNDRIKMLQSSFEQLKKRLERMAVSPTG